jgi:hypothetical protein
MANNLGTHELKNYLDSDITINSVTYPVDTEIVTPIDPNDEIDLATIDLSAADSTSAECCINVNSAGEYLYNLKSSIISTLKGVNWIMSTEAALAETLADAGSDPATPYTTTPGILPYGTSVDVTAGDSYRIRFQAKGDKSEFGSNPYTTADDKLTNPAQLLLYWEEDDYVQRFDAAHGREKADWYENTDRGEIFLINPWNEHSLIPLGDIQDKVTIARATDIMSFEKGNPKRILKKTLSRSEYTVSGAMETEDQALIRHLLGYEIEKDTNAGMMELNPKDTSDIPELEFLFVIYTAQGGIKFVKIPRGQMNVDGDILSTNDDSPFNFNMFCAADSDGHPWYHLMSNGVANLIAIDLKFDVSLT